MKYKAKIFIILFIILNLFFLTGCSKQSEEDLLKEKATNEVEYLSSKLIEILNKLNNISFNNFEVTTAQNQDLNKETAKSSTSSGSSDQGGKSDKDSSDSTSGSGGGSSSQGTSNNTITSMEMSPNTILNPASTTINWPAIKQIAENLYLSWSTVILDLYKLNVDNDSILGFSASLDTATTYIKNEDKSNSLLAVSSLYGYLPKYMETISSDNSKKNIIKTKSYLLNAYALIETDNWEDVKAEINKADETFRIVSTDTNFVSQNSFKVNKAYILLNELKTSTISEDKQIFYIKYKNLLEELVGM